MRDEGTGVSRRDTLRLLGLAPLAAALGWSTGGLERAATYVASLPVGDAPAAPLKFFTAREWPTVRMLADYIIPRDERSGSATDAKAPEFIDFMLMDETTPASSRVAMRGGLAWLDTESRERFGGKRFIALTDAQRRQILDDIAWPKKARPEMSSGVAFFNRFRDAVASAFFSSAEGWKDLQYIGNTFNPNWNGCPRPALDKLGVSYEEYDASLAARRKA
ncbi:MAG TPA: gluconate 2-dehydrogenase subunit 3 family protein [Gemmatimonadaceae bacterium]|nr:gluconate 2-dehydrogenase subunit 3 family protein [Gemmatimonadaceae bacterium]